MTPRLPVRNYRMRIALKFNSFVAPTCTRARKVVARETVEVETADALARLAAVGAGVDRDAVPVWACGWRPAET